MSPVTLSELDPKSRALALQKIGKTDGAADPTQISKLDISDRAALIERSTLLHNKAQQAYALRDEQRREAGKILLELRTATPHGEWEPQLKEICKAIGMSRSTAHNYMNSAVKGSVPKAKAPAIEKAKEIAQRLQDECRNVGLNVDVFVSRDPGKFHITYRNLSEAEIQQAIDAAKRRIA